MMGLNTENDETFVYLIGLYYSYGELDIFGIYTDRKMLLEAYKKLMVEDERCSQKERFSQKPKIYKLPLNKFLGRKGEWCSADSFIFYDELEEYEVSIEEKRL